MDLPPAIVDKYFGADYFAEPFEYRTAQAICQRCVAQLDCLEDAITSTAPYNEASELMRGGQSSHAIQTMRHEHFTQGVSAAELAVAAIRRLSATRRLDRSRRFREGGFPDAVPVLPAEPRDQ
jgi:hypothetical protein